MVDDRRQDRCRRATPASTAPGSKRPSPAGRSHSVDAVRQRGVGVPDRRACNADAVCIQRASERKRSAVTRRLGGCAATPYGMRRACIAPRCRRCACTARQGACTVLAPSTHPPREPPRGCDDRHGRQALRRVRAQKERGFRGGGRGTGRGKRPGARAERAEKPLFRAATSPSKTSGRPLESAARINQLRDTPCSPHNWSTRVS